MGFEMGVRVMSDVFVKRTAESGQQMFLAGKLLTLLDKIMWVGAAIAVFGGLVLARIAGKTH